MIDNKHRLPIIHSLLDTDLYKLTMMQVVLHRFPGAMVTYQFKCRTPGVDLAVFQSEIQSEIEHYCSLNFKEDELAFLKKMSFFKDDFIEFLRIFRPYSSYLTLAKKDTELSITIAGPWLHTILFEVPLLSIVNEVYFRNTYPDLDMTEAMRRLNKKMKLVQSRQLTAFKFFDFGTRRRFSKDWQYYVLARLMQTVPENFSGTSNVLFAKQFGIKAIGTMAHEYIQACQALGPRLAYSQKFAFENWAQEYRGDLGIALSDTYGVDPFIRDFDLYFCKLFDGARQDSGDPVVWAQKMIAHYRSMRIDPKTKLLVFSDSLTFPLAFKLWDLFCDHSRLAFGIGTNLMNDIGRLTLDIVIKMVACNGQPVAKISDTPSKMMSCDTSYLQYLKQVFQINHP